MKTAREIKAGNTIKVGSDVFIILKSEFNKSGRNSAVMKFKMKNLISGAVMESVYKADDKMDDVRLDRRKMKYLYVEGNSYSFQDQESWDQVDLTEDDLGDSINFIVEEMDIDVIFYEGRAVGVELPNSVDRPIEYTEPGVRGDTTGRVLKIAKLANGYEVQVPLFCEIGDVIRIDTRTGEYLERVK